MVKKVIPFLMVLLFTASIGFAAPLTDYSAGKASIDLTWSPNLDSETDSNYGSGFSADGKNGNFDVGLTVGLGNKFALQYRQFDPETEFIPAAQLSYETKNREVNLLYQLDKNWSLFAGYHKASWSAYREDGSFYSETNDKNSFQGGVIGNIKFDNKFTGYTVLGFGKDLRNYEVGVAYAVAPNVDLNVGYRSLTVDNLAFKYPFNGESLEQQFKGMNYGITYKF